MAKTIAVAVGKGGTGKTTTTDNIATALANAGGRVLAVDLDYQRNLTRNMGFLRGGYDGYCSAADVLRGAVAADVAITRVRGKLDLLPAAKTLALVEAELKDAVMGQLALRRALESLAGDYDYILIDTPASNQLLILNALFAADVVISPAQPDYNALSSFMAFVGTLRSVQQHHRPLRFGGVVVNMYDPKAAHYREMLAQLAESELTVFASRLPFGRYVGTAAERGEALVDFRPKNNLARQFVALAEEVALC